MVEPTCTIPCGMVIDASTAIGLVKKRVVEGPRSIVGGFVLRSSLIRGRPM